MNAQLSIARIEPRLSPDFVTEPDHLLTTLDGDRVLESVRYGDRDVAQYGIEQVKGWIGQDLQRYRDWERSLWQFVNVRLVAVAEVRAGERVVGSLQIDGPALGGLESDCGDDYMSEVVAELADEFRHELALLGFADVTHIEPSPFVWES